MVTPVKAFIVGAFGTLGALTVCAVASAAVGALSWRVVRAGWADVLGHTKGVPGDPWHGLTRCPSELHEPGGKVIDRCGLLARPPHRSHLGAKGNAWSDTDPVLIPPPAAPRKRAPRKAAP